MARSVQDLLMQTYRNESRTIGLIPASPADWTADFKLYAPLNTTFAGELKEGKIASLTVTPEERIADVIVGC